MWTPRKKLRAFSWIPKYHDIAYNAEDSLGTYTVTWVKPLAGLVAWLYTRHGVRF